MKKVIVQKKVSVLEKMIKNYKNPLKYALITIISSVILLSISIPYSKTLEFQKSTLLIILVYSFFAVQILSVIGFIISIIQLIFLKKFEFTRKQLITVLSGLIINLAWISLFTFLIISVIDLINS